MALLGLPVLSSLTGCARTDWSSLPSTEFDLATGNTGGVFVEYGTALAAVLDRRLSGTSTHVRFTNASVENVELVSEGRADIGFCLGDTAADAIRGTGAFASKLDVVALARMYDSFLHLVVPADSPVRTPDQLRGRRVGTGAVGSGTRVTATRVLEQAGVGLSDTDVSTLPLGQSAEALRSGDLDAFFFVSGVPNAAIVSLSKTTPIRLIDLEALVVPMVDKYGPQYVAGPVPASAYGLDSVISTVSVKNYTLAGRNMPERTAYAVTRVIFEEQEAIARLAPTVRQPTLGAALFTSPLDLHPGAIRYFREKGR